MSTTTEPTGTQILEVSDAAAAKIAGLLAQEAGSESLALRVVVKPGGCSGFSYDMYFDSDIAVDDSVNQLGESVRVVVDPASAQMLRGATLDYSDNLQQAGFHIVNPNATKTCGCGNSFS